MNDVDSASMEELETAEAILDRLRIEDKKLAADMEQLKEHVRELYELLDMAQIKHTTWP